MWITSCAYKSNAGLPVPLQICLFHVKQSPAGLTFERFILRCFTKKNAAFDVTDKFMVITAAELWINCKCSTTIFCYFWFPAYQNLFHLGATDGAPEARLHLSSGPLLTSLWICCIYSPALPCVRGQAVLRVRVSSWMMCWGSAPCPRLWPCHLLVHWVLRVFFPPNPMMSDGVGACCCCCTACNMVGFSLLSYRLLQYLLSISKEV